MNFRVTTRQDPKFMSHSFLSDPAFSPDPHSNPYFVSNGEPAWAFSPLVGHPVLKKKNRRPASNFAHPISAGDFDFQLIQPPNSPDIPTSATQTASSSPLLNDPGPHSPQAAPEALKPSDATPSVNNSKPSPPPSPPPPPLEQAKEENKKKRRMPFLSRRKSSLTPASAPSTTNVQDKKAQIQAIRSDVTQRSQPVPARNISEPMSQNGVLRPAALSRPATSGASTPTARSVITSGSGAPSQNTSARSQDLDRIDELDETNPWGISLHHGGPYEAASQALRNPMFPGQGSSMLNEYPRQVFHAHGNPYFPPQVPEGVSLGLSPGQILPRNFVIPQGRYPRRQATVGSTRETMTPKIMASTPALRRQSQPVPTMSTFPNPHPIIPHDLPPPAPPPPPSHPQRQPETLRLEPKPKTDVLSFDIGMAMLQSEASESSNPSIYLQPETINGSEFDPYDPVHLETTHSRTPSPLVHESSPERSREPTPDPLSERLIPQPTIFRKAPEHPDSLRPGSNNQVPNNNTPPLYREVDAVSLPTKQIPAAQPQDQSQIHSRNHSPLPPPSTAPYGNVDRNDSILPLGLETPAAEVKPVSANPASPQQLPNEEREQSGAQITINRNIREQVNLGLTTAPDYDARSTNQSISTYTSSQMRNGRPPPHRRVPKHLVMPAPLNTAVNNPARPPPTRTQQTRPPSQFGPATVQVQIRAQSPYSTGPQMLGPFVPNLVSQEKQVASGGKLRKKLSTRLIPPKTNMSSAPIIANVSFAPPVIGYGPPSSLEAASNPSRISKRFLSKRRMNL